MRPHVTRLQDLRFLLDCSITAKHIGTFPVNARHASEDAQIVQSFMKERDFDVLPLEDEEGTITDYVERSSLGSGRCADYERSFFPSEVVADSTPLGTLFKILWDSPQVFVLENNVIAGIITRADLQKAPVRILLFGLVTLLEIQILHLIRDYHPNDSWEEALSPGRLDKAKELYKERLARNEEIDLADCLQLCDKRALVLKDKRIRGSLSFGSNAEAERFLKGIEKLRDRLAHGQDIVAGSSWHEVLSGAENREGAGAARAVNHWISE